MTTIETTVQPARVGKLGIAETVIREEQQQNPVMQEPTSLALNSFVGTRVVSQVVLPDNTRKELSGWGTTLSEALGEMCKSISAKPFTVVSAATEERNGGHLARVLVRAEDQPERLFLGSVLLNDSDTALVGALVQALSNGDILKRKYQHSGHREAEASAATIMRHMETVSGQQRLSPESQAELHALILSELSSFASGVVVTTLNTPGELKLLSRFDTRQKARGLDGQPITENTATPVWQDWYVGLENGHRTLHEVNSEMPAVPASAIPWLVRQFENPAGWLKFRGAISLENHNRMHVLLGRGLQDQDEAFVLGFTMGSTKNLWRIEQEAFKFVVSKVYTEPYRITGNLLPAYDLGVQAGKEFGARNIFSIDLSQYDSLPLREVREKLGIDVEKLKAYFRREAEVIPGTAVSSRLSGVQ